MMATPQQKNPCPGGHESKNLGRPFLGDHYYILSLFDLCLGVEKMIFIGQIYFHYTTYMATPQRKNPCPWGHEINNFGRPFLGHHYYILSMSDLCLGVEKKIFQEIHQFLNFYPKITPLGGGGHERRWVILSSQEPTEVQISKLKLKLQKKSEMYFSYCIESKDFMYAFSNCSVKQNIDEKNHKHEGYAKMHKISGNLTFQS